MTVLEWLGVAFVTVLAFVGTLRLRVTTAPTSTERARRAMRSWWPFGETLLRAWIRLGPIATVGLWLVPAILVAGIGTPAFAAGGVWPWQEYLFLGLVGLFVLWLSLMATVVLFNWPSWIVAEHLRKDSGALSSWISGGEGSEHS